MAKRRLTTPHIDRFQSDLRQTEPTPAGDRAKPRHPSGKADPINSKTFLRESEKTGRYGTALLSFGLVAFAAFIAWALLDHNPNVRRGTGHAVLHAPTASDGQGKAAAAAYRLEPVIAARAQEPHHSAAVRPR